MPFQCIIIEILSRPTQVKGVFISHKSVIKKLRIIETQKF